MKAHIANTQKNLDMENIRDDLVSRREYLKYEIRKFSIKFLNLSLKNTKTETLLLEKKIKITRKGVILSPDWCIV